jgi:hypothetical protein
MRSDVRRPRAICTHPYTYIYTSARRFGSLLLAQGRGATYASPCRCRQKKVHLRSASISDIDVSPILSSGVVKSAPGLFCWQAVQIGIGSDAGVWGSNPMLGRSCPLWGCSYSENTLQTKYSI